MFRMYIHAESSSENNAYESWYGFYFRFLPYDLFCTSYIRFENRTVVVPMPQCEYMRNGLTGKESRESKHYLPCVLEFGRRTDVLPHIYLKSSLGLGGMFSFVYTHTVCVCVCMWCATHQCRCVCISISNATHLF